MRRVLVPLLGSIFVAVTVLATPIRAHAADVPFFYGPVLNCTGFFKIDLPKTDTTASTTYQAVSNTATNNLPPCQSLCDVFVLVNNLIKLLVSVLVTIFTPLMIVIGAFYILLGGGNPGYRATGKKIITGTLVALAIMIFSALLVSEFMTFIFNRNWGDTLKQKLQQQASQTGADPSKIPNFQWNTLSCTPGGSGGVQISTGNTTSTASTTTSGGNTGGTTGTTGSGTATAGTCYSDAEKARLTCQWGWKTGTGACNEPGKPHYCNALATPNTCYYSNPQTTGIPFCRGSWQPSPTCTSPNGRVCVTGSGSGTTAQSCDLAGGTCFGPADEQQGMTCAGSLASYSCTSLEQPRCCTPPQNSTHACVALCRQRDMNWTGLTNNQSGENLDCTCTTFGSGGGTGGTTPAPTAAPPSPACAQSGGTACLASTACTGNNTQVGDVNQLGCTGGRVCCRQPQR